MFKKKTKTTPRQRITLQRTLPVDRYYSSSSARRASLDGRSRQLNSSRLDGAASERKPAYTLRQLAAGGLRWAGFIGICIVIVFNVALSGVGVKVSSGQAQSVYRNDEEYVSKVQSVFDDSPLYRTKATFNSGSFETAIKRALPEVEIATAVVPLVGLRLQVGLRIAQPLCRVQLDPTRQAVVAENGVIVMENKTEVTASEYSELPLLRLEPSVGLKAGDSLLTTQEVDLLRSLNSEFDGSDNSRPALESVTYMVTKREMRARIVGATYYIKLATLDREPTLQVGSALATIKHLQEQGTAPKEYIDVRVSGRVFVK